MAEKKGFEMQAAQSYALKPFRLLEAVCYGSSGQKDQQVFQVRWCTKPCEKSCKQQHQAVESWAHRSSFLLKFAACSKSGDRPGVCLRHLKTSEACVS